MLIFVTPHAIEVMAKLVSKIAEKKIKEAGGAVVLNVWLISFFDFLFSLGCLKLWFIIFKLKLWCFYYIFYLVFVRLS